MIGKNNFYTVYGWMCTELMLKNTELTVYAVIYSFPPGKKCGIGYISEFTGASRATLFRVLGKLEAGGLIEKKREGYVVSGRRRTEAEGGEVTEYCSEEYAEIVAYLNEQAGTNYRAGSAKTKSFIHARIAEGYTVADFKTVIRKKCREWYGTEMAKFLRPETLFGTKFESYLNAPEISERSARISDGVRGRDDLSDIIFTG